MIKILTIIGARPQIIKAAALSRTIRQSFSNEIKEIIVHTGQHYDYNMSEVFIKELDIPQPDYNLQLGSGRHGSQTASMISGIEELLIKEQPDWCVMYGDTNSTLAAAIAAAKIHIPIIHIEAGLRSFDKTMSEELNRIACDHFSTLLFAPTHTAINNLQNEGFKLNTKAPYTINNPCIFHSGDIMYDNTLFFLDIAKKNSKIIENLELINTPYCLCTIHRDHNTDNINNLKSIFKTLLEVSKEISMTFVLPIHPRTKNTIKQYFTEKEYESLMNDKYLKIIDPVSFLDMSTLESQAEIIITDSGGVQKEAYFFKKPCVILRNTTEWVEILEQKAGVLVGANSEKIRNGILHFIGNKDIEYPEIFGNGTTAQYICNTIVQLHEKKE